VKPAEIRKLSGEELEKLCDKFGLSTAGMDDALRKRLRVFYSLQAPKISESEKRARATANKKILQNWWKSLPPQTLNGKELRLFTTKPYAAYIAIRSPYRIGFRRIDWTLLYSVDLTRETLFNDKGKLPLRRLRLPKAYKPKPKLVFYYQ